MEWKENRIDQGAVTLVVHGWRSRPGIQFSSTEQGGESKTILKIEPHRFRKPFQRASCRLTIILFSNSESTIRLFD